MAGVPGPGLGVLEPVALALGLDDPAAVGEPVQRGPGELKGTKISIRRLIRSNVRHCAASSHHGRKDVGVRSSVLRILHLVAPRVGYDFDGNTRSLIIA